MTDEPGRRPWSPRSLSKPMIGAIALLALLVVAAVILVVSRGSDPEPDAPKTVASAPAPGRKEVSPALRHDFTGDGQPGVDHANRRALRGPINRRTVADLTPAWTRPIDGASKYGSYTASPVIVDGVIYSQDLASNVETIDLKTGDMLWRATYDAPSEGPNGVVVGGGKVYGTTPSRVFALDQKTGEELWSVELARTADEGIDMAPGFHDGRVYVSTVPVTPEGGYSPTVAGTLWALDAKTGRKIWSFRTIAKGRKGGGAAGGGLWYTPAFDDRGGLYFGVGNPSPWPGTTDEPWGSGRPGPNLYSNSIVKLDEKTGKRVWHYQQTPHDIYDWDLQGPPILLRSGGRDVVLIGGKSGVVLALDRSSGRLLWKRRVGRHNGHDEDNLLAMRKQYKKLEVGATIYPGILGGVIAPMASDGKLAFVPVVNQAATVQNGERMVPEGDMAGELVALAVGSGKQVWKTKLDSVSFGSLTVANDVLFATTLDGTVRAFSTRTGKELWSDKLPAGTNAGVMVSGNTLVVPAGMVSEAGQTAQIVGYRLPKKR